MIYYYNVIQYFNYFNTIMNVIFCLRNGKTTPLAICDNRERSHPIEDKERASNDPIGQKQRDLEESDPIRQKQREIEEEYSPTDRVDRVEDVPYAIMEPINVLEDPETENDKIGSNDRSMRRSPSYNQAVAPDTEAVAPDSNTGPKQRKFSDGKYYSSVNNEEV